MVQKVSGEVPTEHVEDQDGWHPQQRSRRLRGWLLPYGEGLQSFQLMDFSHWNQVLGGR